MDPSLSVALYRRYWSYMSLSLWGEVGPLGLGEGELACGIVWPCMCSAVLFAWCVGVGALVVGQSRIESEFPPSVAYRRHLPPRGTAFGFCICFMGWLKRDGFFGLLLCSCWGGGGCFCFPILVDVQKNPTS